MHYGSVLRVAALGRASLPHLSRAWPFRASRDIETGDRSSSGYVGASRLKVGRWERRLETTPTNTLLRVAPNVRNGSKADLNCDRYSAFKSGRVRESFSPR